MTSDKARERRRQAERLGHLAEHAAAWLLRCKGYRIIERRVRTAYGEIDLVATRGKVIAFVEVKARPSHDQALEAVTPRQANGLSMRPTPGLPEAASIRTTIAALTSSR